MKKLVVIALAAITSVSAFGQGQINFNNRVIGAVVAPVYGVNPAAPSVRISGNATTNGGSQNYAGIPLVSGTNFSAQIFYGLAGTPINALQPTAASTIVPFRSTAATGGFIANQAAAVTLNGVDFGQTADIQMRVWDNQGGTITSWAAAVARGDVAAGSSDIFSVSMSANASIPPPNMVGLTSFNLTVVPEPSVIALGALALGALLLRRRKS
jgi:hypothetical protein